MSAWPEAYYVINQLSNQLDLSKRVLRLEGKIFVFAKPKTGKREPDITVSGVEFKEGSLWFVEKDVENSNQIYALSIYSEQTNPGSWSDFHILSVDVNNISFNPTSGNFPDYIEDIGAAINYLATQIGTQTTISGASTTEAGIVRIGSNINIDQNYSISVNDAATNRKGVVQLADSATGTSTDRAVTQKAVNDALAQKANTSDVASAAQAAANSAISSANFLSQITIGSQNLNVNTPTLDADQLKTDLGLGTAAYQNVVSNATIANTSDLVPNSLLKTVNDSLTNAKSNALILVPSSGWSGTATEINGTSLYYQTINRKVTSSGTSTFKVHNANPTIGIGVPTNRTPQIPTQAEIDAFSSLYAAVATAPSTSNGNITFYATETPQTDFYVFAKGVN